MGMLSIIAQAIVGAIESHIAMNGGYYGSWYCGIAADPVERLKQHNAGRAEAAKYWSAGTDTTAREIEQYFLAKGCQGGTGGGDSATIWVYVYKISATTRE